MVFNQKGLSLLELLVASLIMIIVSLFVCSIFMHGSINVVTSWEETTVLSCMQELAEEVRGVSRDPGGRYSYIIMREDAGNQEGDTTHYHINIPTFVHTDKEIDFTVVAHTRDNLRDNENNNTQITPVWDGQEGNIGTPTFTPSSLITNNDGIAYGKVTFPNLATGTTRARGYLYIAEGTRRVNRNIIVYPKDGERIKEKEGGDLTGTRTAMFELFDDPEDNTPGPDLLPGDYMKGTVTFTWERRKGKGRERKDMVTIIAPFPEP